MRYYVEVNFSSGWERVGRKGFELAANAEKLAEQLRANLILPVRVVQAA